MDDGEARLAREIFLRPAAGTASSQDIAPKALFRSIHMCIVRRLATLDQNQRGNILRHLAGIPAQARTNRRTQHMKRPGLVVLIIGTAALSGCGGGSTEGTQPSTGGVAASQTVTTTADKRDAASGDEAEIRALVERYVSAHEAQDWETVCDSLAPSARQQLAVATGAISGGEISCPDSFAELAKMDLGSPSIEITSVKVNGDSAVAPEADTTDGTSDLRFERVDGRWLVGIDDDGTSNDTGAALRERVKAWPATWCKLGPGATQREIRNAMGKPTETYDDQDSWSGYGTSLTVFYDADMAAYQLQVNSGTVPCERTRKAAGRD